MASEAFLAAATLTATQQATLRLAAQVNSKKFEDGEAIIHQGDEDGDEMFIVRSNGHH